MIKMCGTQVSILGLLENDPATVPDGLPLTPCNFMLFKQVYFSEAIRIFGIEWSH